jgi:hypothetical protein
MVALRSDHERNCHLVISLAELHAAAWWSHERKLPWQILDYALDLVTLVSLVAALAGIQQSAVAEILQNEFARRKAEQARLVYLIKSTLTNDCHPKETRKEIWTPSPEPYQGACDRVEHFLPQIEYAFGRETGQESMTGDNAWARNLLVREEGAVGSWKSLYNEAHRFIDGSRRTQSVLDTQRRLSSESIKALAGSGKLEYWQYLLAFTFGVKIAKKSAGALESKAKELKGKSNPITAQAPHADMEPSSNPLT